jgi:hypothetical protein
MDGDGNQEQACAGCGRAFTCGMQAGMAHCWCADLPALRTPPESGTGCFCPDCLKKMLGEESLREP